MPSPAPDLANPVQVVRDVDVDGPRPVAAHLETGGHQPGQVVPATHQVPKMLARVFPRRCVETHLLSPVGGRSAAVAVARVLAEGADDTGAGAEVAVEAEGPLVLRGEARGHGQQVDCGHLEGKQHLDYTRYRL